MDEQLRRTFIEMLSQSKDNPAIYAKNVYDWIEKNIKYSNQNSSTDLKICLEKRKGDYLMMAEFFVEFCRTGGIPARVISGLQAGSINKPNCWAEFQLPTAEWIPIDYSPAGGFGHLSNNHLPMIKANEMKFRVPENMGSKNCGFIQKGYWQYFFDAGSEGKAIRTEFIFESFAYEDMPKIENKKDSATAYQEARVWIKRKNYDRAIQLFRWLCGSEFATDKNLNVFQQKIAECYLRKNYPVKSMLELYPVLQTNPSKSTEQLFMTAQSYIN
jgi:hypothetical protein